MGDRTVSNSLPRQRRVITTHNASGESIFNKNVPDAAPVQVLTPETAASLAFVTAIPPKITSNDDIANYERLLAEPPGLTIPNSTILRWYDMAPGFESSLHRTVSIDYLVVLFGELQLTLDSGEQTILKPGEVVVQRGTMHSWKNIGTGWARTLAVTIMVEELVVGGRKVGEDLGSIEGFRTGTN